MLKEKRNRWDGGSTPSVTGGLLLDATYKVLSCLAGACAALWRFDEAGGGKARVAPHQATVCSIRHKVLRDDQLRARQDTHHPDQGCPNQDQCRRRVRGDEFGHGDARLGIL